MPYDCNDEEGCRDLNSLRRDFNEKHAQNRKDIHALRNEQQKLLLKQIELELKLNPIVGNGKPGLLDKMSGQIAAIAEDVQKIVIRRAAEIGSKEGELREKRHHSRASDKAIAIIGLLLVLAQVYIMVRDSRRQDSIDSLTNIIERQSKSLQDLKTQGTEIKNQVREGR